MLNRMLLNICRAMFIASFLFVLSYDAFAQDQKPSAEPVPAKKNKTSSESCDGAVDIVPGKPSTFTRKRRPTSKGDAKSTDSKPENKPEDKSN